MVHNSSELYSEISERDFRECMIKGDDFFKIELLRPAKIWYSKALGYNFEAEKVKSKIEECDRLLAFELKVVRILALSVLVLLIVYFFTFS